MPYENIVAPILLLLVLLIPLLKGAKDKWMGALSCSYGDYTVPLAALKDPAWLEKIVRPENFLEFFYVYQEPLARDAGWDFDAIEALYNQRVKESYDCLNEWFIPLDADAEPAPSALSVLIPRFKKVSKYMSREQRACLQAVIDRIERL